MEQNSKQPYPSSELREKENFVVACLRVGKEMYKKAWCTCKVVFSPIQPIAFLTFSLTSPSWYLKLPSVKTSGESKGTARGPAFPLIFRPNWGPKSRKNFFWDRAPPLSEGLDPPLKTIHFVTFFPSRVIWGHLTEEIQPIQTNGLKVLIRYIVFAIK